MLLVMFLLLSPTGSFDGFNNTGKELKPREAIIKIMSAKHTNRQVMFNNMVLGKIHRDHLFNKTALRAIYRELEKTNDKRFVKRYKVDVRYRDWAMVNLREMLIFCESLEEDAKKFGTYLDESGHMIVGSLNNTSHQQLTYMIRFLMTRPDMILTYRKNDSDKTITAGQLAAVMQAEQNQRNQYGS